MYNPTSYTRPSGEKYSADYKKNKSLTEFKFQALIGLMLGDLFAERTKSSHNTRLNFEQSKSVHESYLWFLFSLFSNLVGTPPKSPKRKPHPVTNEIYTSLAFKTLKFPCLNIFHDLFYGTTGIKSIPVNISNYFTAISLAFWIMDDGMKAGLGLRLCTDSYTYSDVLILTEMLKTNLDINCNPQKRSDNSWRIYIPGSEMAKVRDLVSPHMHKDMLFKIGL